LTHTRIDEASGRSIHRDRRNNVFGSIIWGKNLSFFAIFLYFSNVKLSFGKYSLYVEAFISVEMGLGQKNLTRVGTGYFSPRQEKIF